MNFFAIARVRIMQPMKKHVPLVVTHGLLVAWRVGAAAVAGGLSACAPALDWREVSIDGPGLSAAFPCRPVSQTRDVPLGGRATKMTLSACEAAGVTFAVSIADVQDPSRVPAALVELRAGSLGKVTTGPAMPRQLASWSVAGATPQPQAGRWRADGTRPDGQSLSMDTAVFSRGTWVIQASAIGDRLDESGQAPFFDGLRFAP
ncbi:hypothetical protein AACH06_07895 [Ideonella sp. DXS29W]|uniref:Uncharacterized protein n=1 Tax=Ideonella lacteola TaxID=2984193 RepID=A0ABU9BLA6_9BURK